MRESLLEILVEPGTHSPLRVKQGRAVEGRIDEGQLEAIETGTVYDIVRGIPRFVPPEGYTDSFGFQWNRFRTVQVDSDTGAEVSQRRFEDETPFSREKVEGRWMLDGGCGAGRFAEIAAARGARLVALDLSSAVDAAARTLSRYPNADVVQGDLLNMPFAPGTFDFAYSIGVIQHTPDRARAIESVVRSVRPGGEFAFSIYARQPWTRLNGKYLVRPLTRRLPPRALLSVIEGVMPALFPVTDVLFRLPLIGKVSRFAIPMANYVERVEFTREQRYNEAILDTFDMLSPRYDAPMTWREVRRVLDSVGVARQTYQTRVPVNVVGER